MVAPVTGPFTVTTRTIFGPPKIPSSDYCNFYKQTVGYKQKYPFDLSLAYSVKTGRAREIVSSGNGSCLVADGKDSMWNSYCSPSLYEARSKAWARFVDKATSQQLGWGENLGQFKQALGMLTTRLGQLTRFSRAINRGDLYGAWRELGLPQQKFQETASRIRLKGQPLKWMKLKDPRKNYVRLPPQKGDKYAIYRSVSDLWLEFHFGWSPLVSDIYGAVALLSNPVLPPKVVHGSGKGATLTEKYNLGSYSPRGYRTGTGRARYTATVEVTNPNVALLAQSGLINPLMVAWQLVPWSFVFDWLSNLSQVLEGYSRLWGLTITKASCTTKEELYEKETWNSYGWSSECTSFRMIRVLGLPIPNFRIKPFKGFSVVRGATAASLLVQQLPKR